MSIFDIKRPGERKVSVPRLYPLYPQCTHYECLSPEALLTLDKQRGGLWGYYMSSITGTSVRRNLYGCGLISPSDDTLRARGWVESGVLPTLSTGGWKLQLGP